MKIVFKEDLSSIGTYIPPVDFTDSLNRKFASYIQNEFIFFDQKTFNTIISELYSCFKYKTDKLSEFIEAFQGYHGHLFVFNVSGDDYENDLVSRLLNHSNREVLKSNTQEYFTSLIQDKDFETLNINTMSYFSNIALRRIAIKDYYTRNITARISSAKSRKAEAKARQFNPVKSGWGFIAAYKPQLLQKNPDKDLYWIKLFANNETKEFVNNTLDRRKCSIYNPDEFIDVFTTDETYMNLVQLFINEEDVLFSVCLNELRGLLQNHSLLDAIEIKEKNK